MKGSTSFDGEGTATARSAGSSRPIEVTAEDEQEFFQALTEYKNQSGRLFPTCSELLEVLKALGYAKRIWRPVEPWSNSMQQVSTNADPNQGSLAAFGWYSSVETPVGP
jgi:hypothetical protein